MWWLSSLWPIVTVLESYRCGGKTQGSLFCTILIAPRCFSVPGFLGCDLHSSVLTLFSPSLKEEDYRDWIQRSILSCVGRFQWSISPWRVGLTYGQCSGYISQLSPFLSHCHRPQGTFLGSHHENQVGLLMVTPVKVWASSDTSLCSPGFLVLMLVHTQPPASCQRWLVSVTTHSWPSGFYQDQVSWLWEWFSAFPCLSRFQGGGLPCDLSF